MASAKLARRDTYVPDRKRKTMLVEGDVSAVLLESALSTSTHSRLRDWLTQEREERGFWHRRRRHCEPL